MANYEGTKYGETVFLSNKIPDDPGLKELKYWCALLHKLKMAPHYTGGSFGNLSYRPEGAGEGEFIITASHSSLGDTIPENFVNVERYDTDTQTPYIHGVKKGSSEIPLHDMLYKKLSKNLGIRAIYHGHCDEIKAAVDKLGILQTSEKFEYGTPELVKSVEEILPRIDKDAPFFFLNDHGFVSLGRTMEEAGMLAFKKYIDALKALKHVKFI